MLAVQVLPSMKVELRGVFVNKNHLVAPLIGIFVSNAMRQSFLKHLATLTNFANLSKMVKVIEPLELS